MKLKSGQIAGFVKQAPQQSAGALLYGPDSGQVYEYAKAIAASAVADPKDPFLVVELTEEIVKADPARLSDELNALSLMGGRRLVKLEAESDAIGKLIAELFAVDPLPEAYLLVTAGELSPRSALRASFEAHPKLAALPCYKDEERSLQQLVRQGLDNAGIRYTREVIDYLAQNMGSDRRVTLNEIDKIVLYAGDAKEIRLDEAMLLVGNSAELGLDDICEAAAGAEFLRLERSINKTLSEGGQPIMVLRSVQRYFQRLQVLEAHLSAGATVDEAIAQLKPKVFFRQEPVLKRHSARWKRQAIQHALRELLEAERICKEAGSPAEMICRHTLLTLATLPARMARAAT